ncbi:hypothetical protein T06_15456 [Trichinella sp. T6]|nr:hypothetical protein T06_15456 [Trichinella sp. T6]
MNPKNGLFPPGKCFTECGRDLEAIDQVTPALKSGRRRGNEVTDEGQTERMERRRGSRDSASATDLGMRMVTRGRKKLMEALVREAVHHPSQPPRKPGSTGDWVEQAA